MHPADELLEIAGRLDDSPTELLNGAALAGLRVIEETADAGQLAAHETGVDPRAVDELWRRAESRLRGPTESETLFAAAADAAVLLYSAAWLLTTDSATTADIEALLA